MNRERISWPVFAFGLSLLSPLSAARGATTLPYFGPDQPDCHVKQPEKLNDLDAGFVTSEDCSYIYILPPKVGRFETYKPQYTYETNSVCDFVDESIEAIKKDSTIPNDGMREIRIAQKLENLFSQIRESFTGAHAFVSAAATLDWNTLIRGYRDANPTLNTQFMAMPIRVGVLSMAGAGQKVGDMGDFDGQPYKVLVSSYQPPISSSKPDVTDLPLYLSFLANDKSSFLMGQAVGLELQLPMLQACQLKKISEPDQYLSGTYTYAYPVQSKGLVKVEFDKSTISSQIGKYIADHAPSFKTEDLVEFVKGQHIFNVSINEGSFPNGDLRDQIEHLREDMSAKATEILLGVLASQSALSMKAATTTIVTNHSQRECHGWIFKRCSNHTWTTTATVIDWRRFAADLEANLKMPTVSAESYKTFFVMSTSAITPAKGVQP